MSALNVIHVELEQLFVHFHPFDVRFEFGIRHRSRIMGIGGIGGSGGIAGIAGRAGIAGMGGCGCASTEPGSATSAKTMAVTKRVYLTMSSPYETGCCRISDPITFTLNKMPCDSMRC